MAPARGLAPLASARRSCACPCSYIRGRISTCVSRGCCRRAACTDLETANDQRRMLPPVRSVPCRAWPPRRTDGGQNRGSITYHRLGKERGLHGPSVKLGCESYHMVVCVHVEAPAVCPLMTVQACRLGGGGSFSQQMRWRRAGSIANHDGEVQGPSLPLSSCSSPRGTRRAKRWYTPCFT